MLDENGQETTEEPTGDEDTSTDSPTDAESTDTSTDNGEENGTLGEQPADAAFELSEEEQAQLEQFESATKKDLNDANSRHGRERSEWDQERAEYRQTINKLTNVVEQTQQAQSEGGQPTGNEDELYRPSQNWHNEDGTINLDAMGEWNYRGLQAQNKEIEGLKQTIKDLGGNVDTIQTQSKTEQDAQAFAKHHGLTADDYSTYKDIQKEQGENAAYDFVSLKRKQTQGQKAAAAHRDQERGGNGAPPMSNGTSPAQVTDNVSIVESVSKDILSKPRGPDRQEALGDLWNKYPAEVAAGIVRQVANASD